MTADDGPKNVLVAGHFWQDNILLKPPVAPIAPRDIDAETTLVRRMGGSWVLRAMLEKIATVNCHVHLPEVRDSSACETGAPLLDGEKLDQAYWIWSQFPKDLSRRRDRHKVVYRVEQCLGYERSESVEIDWEATTTAVGKNLHIFVLDDNELPAFTSSSATNVASPPSHLNLTNATGCLKEAKHIVIRVGSRRKIHLESLINRWGSKVHVVIPIDILQSWGGVVALRSWDQSFEDTAVQLRDNPELETLQHCGTVVVSFGASGALIVYPNDRNGSCCCIFDPRHLKGSLESNWPGTFPGYGSIMASAFVSNLLDTGSTRDSLSLRLTRALEAIRANHRRGGGPPSRGRPPPENWDDLASLVYKHLFNENWNTPDSALVRRSFGIDLGCDFLPDRNAIVVAGDVVTKGFELGLASLPRFRARKYVTVDREEIHSLSFLHGLFSRYRVDRSDTRPLSIAVFGPPGSGKSFAVRELSADVFGEENPFLEFNLTQLAPSDLPLALHLVRDEALSGHVPVVFWDEFDSDNFGWLKRFLAPMQDARFWEANAFHPIGRCVFVFAGSTKKTFEAFEEACRKKQEDKAPDFISRLRGFLNMKGLNRDSREEPPYLPRAILLRSTLERFYPHLVSTSSGEAGVRKRVIDAFLKVEKYEHGARSLQAICSMSSIEVDRDFEPSMLPPADQLRVHVSSDFVTLLRGEE